MAKSKVIAKVGEPKRTPSGIITSVTNEPIRRKMGDYSAPAIIDNEEDLSSLAKRMPDLFVYDSVAKELRMK